MNGQTKRQTELDILRLLALLAVIAIHSSGFGDGLLACGIHAAIVWSVPVFFMISGRFFLDPARSVTPERLMRKYLPHIILAFLVWSVVYTLWYVLSGTYDGLNIFGILTQYIEGPYHFWYLYALAGLYVLTPLLRLVAADDTLMAYFLALFALCNVAFEYLIYLPKIGPILNAFLSRLHLDMVTQYVGYYMLGWFIQRHRDRIGTRLEITIYAVGFLMFAVTIAAECLVSPELRAADFVKQYMKPNVVLYSAALYTFFVKRVAHVHISEKAQVVWGRLTELSFGVYCIHALINEFMPTLPLAALAPVVRVVCIYLASLGLTILIRRIPVIGKKIT